LVSFVIYIHTARTCGLGIFAGRDQSEQQAENHRPGKHPGGALCPWFAVAAVRPSHGARIPLFVLAGHALEKVKKLETSLS